MFVAVLCSAGFIALIAFEAPTTLLLYLGWTALVTVWYVNVRRRLRLRGIDLVARARQHP